MEMELHLARPDSHQSRVTVTCNGAFSHTFDLQTLIPTRTNGLPHPLIDPITYGKALYAALFPTDSLSSQALATKPSRILLVAADEELDALPWEYASGARGTIACTCSFVRGLPPEQRSAPSAILSGLHIVAVASSPLSHSLAPLNMQGEWTRLTEIVDDLDHAVTLERVWPPTIMRLRELVAGQQQRVILFMGHGGQNDEGEAVLCFERDDGTREDISAREFVQRVQGSVFLVTLNACESATPGETNFGNLAKALVREQVPYALGMRFFVHDDDARAFSRDFYSNLARGVPLENALLQARLTLARSERAWACGNLVLYTSLTDAAPGYVTKRGEPDVRDAQEDALGGIIGVLSEVQGAFQGRIDEQIQLGTWLTGDRRPRIMMIHGSGGQGKTALARVAAERFAHAWPGGVWSMTLETAPTRAVFVASLARFLGIPPQDSIERTDLEWQIQLRLRRRRTLLVLDNLETLDEAARAQDAEALSLLEFIQQLPGERTSLLCTSRHLLGWTGEQHLELPGLAPEEGAALFQQSAPDRVEEIERSLARQLSRLVDGHPLGLMLLGRAFNNSSIKLSNFLAEHETYLLSAENMYIGVDHRQRTLYANVAYSVKWLSPDLRSLFGALWLFHAPFLPETAIAIFDPEHEARGEAHSPVADQLHALWQRGLLTHEKVEKQGVLLYRVPSVIRPYIDRYLANAGERARLLARYSSAYAELAHYLYRELDRGGLASALALLCQDDLERGIQQVAGSEQGYCLLHWGWILYRLGDRIQGLSRTEQALEMAQELDQALMLHGMNNMALVYNAIGKPQEALRLYEQALPIMREVGDRSGEAGTLHNMAVVYGGIGRPQEALRLLAQALPIMREVGNRAAEATTLNNMAAVYRNIGRPQEALPLYEQTLPLRREVGDRAGEATTLNNIAGVYRDIGRPQEALRLYKQALPIRREVGDRAGEAVTLNSMAAVYFAIGKLQQALHLDEQALLITREVGDRAAEATTLNNIAGVYRDIGRPQEALRLYEQALPIMREVGDRAGEAGTLHNMAAAYCDIGRSQEALHLYEQALPMRREVGDRAGEAGTLHNMAAAYCDIGRPQEALHLYEQALPIMREVGNSAGEAGTLVNMAILLYQSGQRPQVVITNMEQALDILRATGLLQDAAARTPEMIELELQAMRNGISEAAADMAVLEMIELELQAMRNGTFSNRQSGSSSTIPAEKVNTIVGNTVAVMTTMPQRRAEWREAMAGLLQTAQLSGAECQIEVDFFTAILAILDGQFPSLSDEHPYAAAIAAIQQAIANGGPEGDDQGWAYQILCNGT